MKRLILLICLIAMLVSPVVLPADEQTDMWIDDAVPLLATAEVISGGLGDITSTEMPVRYRLEFTIVYNSMDAERAMELIYNLRKNHQDACEVKEVIKRANVLSFDSASDTFKLGTDEGGE